MERCMTELSSEERLAIYDYVVEFAKARKQAPSVKIEDLQVDFMQTTEKEETYPKSELELMAEERDYKRRRPTYRAKNVHITKKSYTEILREVIQNQMQYLAESSDMPDNALSSRKPDPDSGEKQCSSTTDIQDHPLKRRKTKSLKHKHKHSDRE